MTALTSSTFQTQSDLEKHNRLQKTKAELEKKSEVLTRVEKLLNFYRFNLRRHHNYAYKFFIAELLNVVNVLVQVALTDAFLGRGNFITFGWDMWRWTEPDLEEPRVSES